MTEPTNDVHGLHETFTDALKVAILALGGYKKVGGTLRPELPLATAETWVRHCLDDQRREKFSPDQVLLILRMARGIGCHVAMDWLAADTGYRAAPVDLERQVQALEETIAANLAALNAQVERLTRMRERASQ